MVGMTKFEARIKELVENLPDLAILIEPLLIVRRALRHHWGLSRSASGRSSARVPKAASISLEVLAPNDMQLKSERMCTVPQYSCFGLGITVDWVDQQSDDGCLRRHFV